MVRQTFQSATKETALAKTLKATGFPVSLAQQEGPLRVSRSEAHPMFGFHKKDGLSTLEVGGGKVYGGFELLFGEKGELQAIGAKNYGRSGVTYYKGSPEALGQMSDRILNAGIGTKDDLSWLHRAATSFGLQRQPSYFTQDNLQQETMSSFMQAIQNGMDKAGLKPFSPHAQKLNPALTL